MLCQSLLLPHPGLEKEEKRSAEEENGDALVHHSHLPFRPPLYFSSQGVEGGSARVVPLLICYLRQLSQLASWMGQAWIVSELAKPSSGFPSVPPVWHPTYRTCREHGWKQEVAALFHRLIIQQGGTSTEFLPGHLQHQEAYSDAAVHEPGACSSSGLQARRTPLGFLLCLSPNRFVFMRH